MGQRTKGRKPWWVMHGKQPLPCLSGNTETFDTQPWTIFMQQGTKTKSWIGLHVQAIATTVNDSKLSNVRYKLINPSFSVWVWVFLLWLRICNCQNEHTKNQHLHLVINYYGYHKEQRYGSIFIRYGKSFTRFTFSRPCIHHHLLILHYFGIETLPFRLFVFPSFETYVFPSEHPVV